MGILKAVVSTAMSLFYGVAVIVGIVKLVLTHGFTKTFKRRHIEKPAVLSDPSLGTHGFLRLEDNVRIHYVASGPEDKPLMLFLHGFPEFWFSWRYQIREYQKDYRVVAIDMRGYGESDKPASVMSYAMSHLESDVRQVISGLGYTSCVLVVHDWGGVVGWAFARHYPNMVDKLIVMNAPPTPVFEKLLMENKEQIKMSWYIFFFQLPYLPELLMRLNDFEMLERVLEKVKTGDGQPSQSSFHQEISEEELEAYKYNLSLPGACTPPINYYRATFKGPRRQPYDMNFTMPVLLIWGMNDFALHSDIPSMVQAKNPNIDVTRIPEASHFVQMDNPRATNKAMRDWLKQGN